MNYDEMEAGTEMDIAVARDVMRWHQWDGEEGDYDGPYPVFCDWGDGGLTVYVDEGDEDGSKRFAPSTDIAAAWEVVEKLKFDGTGLFFALEYDNNEIWDAAFYYPSLGDGGMPKWKNAPTAPLAICRAALKAKAVV